MMSFEINGKQYDFDQNRLSLAEAIMVKHEIGLTVKAFNIGMVEMDPEALQAMVWLAKRRTGEAVRLKDVEFDVIAFANSIKNVEVPGEAADPTAAPLTPDGSHNGTGPASGAPNTSERSPTTSG